MRGSVTNRQSRLVTDILQRGLRSMVSDEAGDPKPSAIADYLRAVLPDDAIISGVADWLDPAATDKPYGWKLAFVRGRGQRKKSDNVAAQCLSVVKFYKQKATAMNGQSSKKIVGAVAAEFHISDGRVREYLAATKRANTIEGEMVKQLAAVGPRVR